MGNRQIATSREARDVDTFLDELLPAKMSTKRRIELRTAILDWAEELAYEHGEERFACGEEAGSTSGYDRGWEDAEGELARSYASRSPMVIAMAHRFRERGWSVDAYNGAEADDVVLQMSEQDAWQLLASEVTV